MSARIVQIDLAQPLPTLRADSRRGSFQILVKLGLQPLGWVRCPVRQFGDYITPDMLAQLVSETISPEALDAARERSFELPKQRHTPPASVVVIAKEHPDLLERQLHSLARLQYPSFEVIVIDNSSNPAAGRKICDKLAFARHVHEPRPGLNYARNTGWQVARNEIVAFIDDGAVLDPHWLSMLAQGYVSPSVNCVAGMTLPMELATPSQERFERHLMPQRRFQRRIFKSPVSFFAFAEAGFGGEMSLSLRRAAIERIGGFDPALTDDQDIFVRLLREGGHVVCDPRALAWRHHPRTPQQFRRRVFESAFSFASFCSKYFRHADLAQLSRATFKRWLKRTPAQRLRQGNSIGLIAGEIAGALLGLRGYRRAVRRAQAESKRFVKQGIVRRARSEMKAAA